MSNGNLPAMPIMCSESLCMQTGTIKPEFAGLTKREMFAMAAMQGLLAARDAARTKRTTVVFSKMAVEMADALLAELEK